MARKGFLATLVGVAAFAVPNAFADKGGVPHDGSNGQGRPAEQQQQTAATPPTPAQPKHQAKGKAKGHLKVKHTPRPDGQGKVKTQGRGNAKAESQTSPPTNSHAKAGKTTICHATGSATNPYVTITISNNAIPAHARHQDGRDIIPAPAGGCPTAATAAQQQPAGQQQPAAQRQEQALAAPATGSSTTPASTGQVLGAQTSDSSGAPGQISVLGETTSGRARLASSAPAALETRKADSSGLPFTGADTIMVAILGLAALLLGVTVRRATTNRV
ncbi:MAG: hypothetical protein QOH62_1460 [Solirubrobacteraceae bacterium]|jgi:hypothetical protein|nr:hypothetical protein [Solirubrobacteraceae bacterium]